MKLSNLLFTSIISLSLLFSCGGEKPAEEKQDTAPTSAELMQKSKDEVSNKASQEDNNSEVIEIVIEGNDKMKFNKSEIRVPAGSTVKLTLKHVGKMSKQAMGHNWVLLKQGIKPMEFGQEAAGAVTNGYIPKDTENVITHTKLLGGGESDTIEFKAPEKGTYDFLCSFPGHVALMKGKFIVE